MELNTRSIARVTALLCLSLGSCGISGPSGHLLDNAEKKEIGVDLADSLVESTESWIRSNRFDDSTRPEVRVFFTCSEHVLGEQTICLAGTLVDRGWSDWNGLAGEAPENGSWVLVNIGSRDQSSMPFLFEVLSIPESIEVVVDVGAWEAGISAPYAGFVSGVQDEGGSLINLFDW